MPRLKRDIKSVEMITIEQSLVSKWLNQSAHEQDVVTVKDLSGYPE